MTKMKINVDFSFENSIDGGTVPCKIFHFNILNEISGSIYYTKKHKQKGGLIMVKAGGEFLPDYINGSFKGLKCPFTGDSFIFSTQKNSILFTKTQKFLQSKEKEKEIEIEITDAEIDEIRNQIRKEGLREIICNPVLREEVYGYYFGSNAVSEDGKNWYRNENWNRKKIKGAKVAAAVSLENLISLLYRGECDVFMYSRGDKQESDFNLAALEDYLKINDLCLEEYYETFRKLNKRKDESDTMWDDDPLYIESKKYLDFWEKSKSLRLKSLGDKIFETQEGEKIEMTEELFKLREDNRIKYGYVKFEKKFKKKAFYSKCKRFLFTNITAESKHLRGLIAIKLIK